jgi:hypothetical protein
MPWRPRFVIVTTGLLVGGLAAAGQSTDKVNETRTLRTASHVMTVEYKDGTTERYQLHWTGSIHVHVWSTGSSSRGAVDKPDSEQCHADFFSKVERMVFLLNRSGKIFLAADGQNTIAAPFPNHGAKSVLPLSNEDCNSGQFNSGLGAAIDFMNKNFDQLVADDFNKFKTDAGKDSQVIKVEEPSDK